MQKLQHIDKYMQTSCVHEPPLQIERNKCRVPRNDFVRSVFLGFGPKVPKKTFFSFLILIFLIVFANILLAGGGKTSTAQLHGQTRPLDQKFVWAFNKCTSSSRRIIHVGFHGNERLTHELNAIYDSIANLFNEVGSLDIWVYTFFNQIFFSFSRLSHLYLCFFHVILILKGFVRYTCLLFLLAAGTISSVTPLCFISAVRRKIIFWIFGFVPLFARN